MKTEIIPQGYKQTELGIIPEDWELKSLEDLGDIIVGLTYKPENVKNYGLLVLRSSNIQNDNLSYENNVFVNFKVKENKYVKQGDLLICVRNGSKELIGKCAIIDKPLIATFGAFMSIFRSINNDYIVQYFRTKAMYKQINSNSSATINQITNKDLKSYKICIPNKTYEQQAIANALSDTDKLIESIEKLIEKKKAIKKGAMQQLLTGKTRLPQFQNNEKWRSVILNDIGRTLNGLSGKTRIDFESGNSKYVTFLNVLKNIDIDPDIYEIVNIKQGENQTQLLKGDLLFNTSSETPEDVGMCAVYFDNKKNIYLNSFCFVYRLNNLQEISSHFIAYLFRSQIGRSIMIAIAQGSTRYNLSKSLFLILSVSIPPTIKEQNAIAEILSDMDSEIEALEKKLNKYQQIKFGMMDQLLTGKIRLIESSAMLQTKKMSQAETSLIVMESLNEAVIIGGIVNAFGKIGRVKEEKLLYFYKKKFGYSVESYLKKAAGPYDHKLRYGGGESIAKDNNYITEEPYGEGGKVLVKGKCYREAQSYIDEWQISDKLNWLHMIFQYYTKEDLELLSTVDQSIDDLTKLDKEVSVISVKNYIASIPVWKEKLSKPHFADHKILDAMAKLSTILN